MLSVRFYAGGSERSGQQIVGPPRKKSPNELVEDLFKGAKEHGAVAVDRTAKSGGETSKPKVRSDEFFLLLFPVSVVTCVWLPPCQLFGTVESRMISKGQRSLNSFLGAALVRVSQWQEKPLSGAVFVNLFVLVTAPAAQQMLLTPRSPPVRP